jgi:hypothetical protein
MTIRNAERKLQIGSPSAGAATILYPRHTSREVSGRRFEELDAEIAKARRHGYDLAVVVLTARPQTRAAAGGIDYWARETRMSGDLALLTAVAVGEALREGDVVCYQPLQQRMVVALPLANFDGAHAALWRVKAHLSAKWRLHLRGGVAQLLRDAATLDWLMAVAATRIADPTQAAVGSDPVGATSMERRNALPSTLDPAAGGTHGDAA